MFSTLGTLVYSENPYKLIVQLDNNIGLLYRSLCPKYFNIKPPKYPTHISVVRNEIPTRLFIWRKYQNKEISVNYNNYIFNDNIYFWLEAFSKELENIRLELGLENISKYTQSPDKKCKFHITIGNLKNT